MANLEPLVVTKHDKTTGSGLGGTEKAIPPVTVRLRRLGWTGLRLVSVLCLLFWTLMPFYLLGLIAIQSRASSLSIPPEWFPKPDFSNFSAILTRAVEGGPAQQTSDLIFPGIVNSALVATVVAFVNLALGSIAAYGFSRYRFPGSRRIPLTLLASQMVPAFATIVPFFVILRTLGLINTRLGVAIALVSITLPFTVWLLLAYVDGIPNQIEKAARMDGASRTAAMVRVALPLARPGLISVGLFAFMIAWNDFVFATILNSSTEEMLVQPAIAGLYNTRQQSFGLMAAGAILAATPTILLAIATQRFLIRGLLSGTGKA